MFLLIFEKWKEDENIVWDERELEREKIMF